MIDQLKIIELMDHAAKLYKEVMAERNRPKCPQCAGEIVRKDITRSDPGEYKGDEIPVALVYAQCGLCGWESEKTTIIGTSE